MTKKVRIAELEDRQHRQDRRILVLEQQVTNLLNEIKLPQAPSSTLREALQVAPSFEKAQKVIQEFERQRRQRIEGIQTMTGDGRPTIGYGNAECKCNC